MLKISQLYPKIHVLCKPGSTQPFAYFRVKDWMVPDYYLGFEDLANCDLDSFKITYWTIN